MCRALTMQRSPRGLQKVLLAAPTLELAPAPTAGIAIGPNLPPPHPAIIGTARRGTELRRAVHLARPSLGGGKQRRRDTRGRRARLWGLLTRSTAGSVGEPGKRLGVAGGLGQWEGGLTCGRAGGGSTSCPPFIEEDAQPQEAYQQEAIEKEMVYHGISLLFGEPDDRLPDSEAGDLSARWRYTTGQAGQARIPNHPQPIRNHSSACSGQEALSY